MAMDQDGDCSSSSPLLRQILQPQPLSDSDGGAEIDIGQDHDEDDDNDNDDDGQADRDVAAESPNDDAVAENVVSIVDGMGLGEHEAAALRLAIARGDANIRGALELFRWVDLAVQAYALSVCALMRILCLLEC